MNNLLKFIRYRNIMITNAIIVFVAIMLLSLQIMMVAHAEANITMEGKGTVAGGEKFTKVVTFDGNVGRVNGSITYDTNMLTYISGGSSSGNTGYIQLSDAGTNGSVSFDIVFQAVSEGSTDINVQVDEIYDLNESELSQVSYSDRITITGDAKEEEKVKEEPDPTEVSTQSMGVDEKTEAENTAPKPRITVGMIVGLAILLILIIAIICILSIKKRK